MKKEKHFSRAEREFGWIVGGVLVLLSAWWFYRGKFLNVAQVTLPLGVLLVILGSIYPRALVFPNRVWIIFGEALSFVSTRIILAFVFFGVLMPIGLIKRALGWDPLHRRGISKESNWYPYSTRQQNPRHYEKMF